jgi:excisionase family DNA binding protein
LKGIKIMPKSDDFYTFEEVLKELKVSEDELKKMVSEGEIRAFKDDDKMKFKKEDIESKKSENITDPTVILQPDELEIPVSTTDETFVEDSSSSSATDIGGDTDIHVPNLMEEALVTNPVESTEDTVVNLGEEEINAAETIIEDAAAAQVPEELVQSPKEKTRSPRSRKKISRFASPSPEKEIIYPESISVTMPIPKFKTPVIFIVLLGVLLLFLIFVGSFIGDSLRISSGRGKYPIGITREFGQLILDIVGINDAKLDKFKKEE